MFSVTIKKYNVARYLLSQGADVNYVAPDDPWQARFGPCTLQRQ